MEREKIAIDGSQNDSVGQQGGEKRETEKWRQDICIGKQREYTRMQVGNFERKAERSVKICRASSYRLNDAVFQKQI